MCFEPALLPTPCPGLREGTLVKSAGAGEQTARTLCDGDALAFLGSMEPCTASLPAPVAPVAGRGWGGGKASGGPWAGSA